LFPAFSGGVFCAWPFEKIAEKMLINLVFTVACSLKIKIQVCPYLAAASGNKI
jgi:hypothetical protein